MPDISYVVTRCPDTGDDLDLDRLRGLAIADAAVRARRAAGAAVTFAPAAAAGAAARERLDAFGIGYDWDAGLDPDGPQVAAWAAWLLKRLAGADRLYRDGDGTWRLRTGPLHAGSEAALERLSEWTPAAVAAQRELLEHVEAPAGGGGGGGGELASSLAKLAAAGWSVENRKDRGEPDVQYAAGDLPVATGESWEEPGGAHPRLTRALALLLAGSGEPARVGEPGELAAGWLPAALAVVDRDAAADLLDLRTVARALRDAGALELPGGEPIARLVQHRPVRLKAVRRRPDPNADASDAESAADPNDLSALVAAHGSEAVRFALLHAAAPEKRFGGGTDVVGYAARFLDRLREFALPRLAAAGGAGGAATVDSAIAAIERGDGLRRRLARWCEVAAARTAENHAAVAPHLATRNAIRLLDRVAAFEALVAARRGTPAPADVAAVASALAVLARLVEPLAPATAGDLLAAAGTDADAPPAAAVLS